MKPVTSLTQTVAFAVSHEDSVPRRAPAPARRTGPTITTRPPADVLLAEQAGRAEAARRAAVAALRALEDKKKRRGSPPPPPPPSRRSSPPPPPPPPRDPEAMAALAAKAAAFAKKRLALEMAPAAPAVAVSRWTENFLRKPKRGGDETSVPFVAALDAPMNDFIIEGFRDRHASSRPAREAGASTSSSDDEIAEADDESQAGGADDESQASAGPPRPKRDRYFEGQDSSEEGEAPAISHADVIKPAPHKLRRIAPEDLDQIRANGAATVLSARLASVSDTVGSTITQLKRQIATKSAKSIEAGLSRLREEIAARERRADDDDDGDDEPTDANLELDKAAAALELFERHVSRAERALETAQRRVSGQAAVARDCRRRLDALRGAADEGSVETER